MHLFKECLSTEWRQAISYTNAKIDLLREYQVLGFNVEKIKYLQMSGYTSGLIGLCHNQLKKWYSGITMTSHFLNECLLSQIILLLLLQGLKILLSGFEYINYWKKLISGFSLKVDKKPHRIRIYHPGSLHESNEVSRTNSLVWVCHTHTHTNIHTDMLTKNWHSADMFQAISWSHENNKLGL